MVKTTAMATPTAVAVAIIAIVKMKRHPRTSHLLSRAQKLKEQVTMLRLRPSYQMYLLILVHKDRVIKKRLFKERFQNDLNH